MNPHVPGHDEVLGSSCTAKFDHIHKLYALEENKSLKIACDLKKASLNPGSIARTSPQHALGEYHSYSTSLIIVFGLIRLLCYCISTFSLINSLCTIHLLVLLETIFRLSE